MDVHRVWVRKNPRLVGTNEYITVYVDDTPVIGFGHMETLNGFAQALMAEINGLPKE